MLKVQIRSHGHKAIVKNNKSHQEVFDELSQTEGVNLQLLADELSKIPSNGKQKSTGSLRYIFVAALVILAIMRILALVLIGMEGTLDLGFLLFMLIIILIAPGIGIFAAFSGRAHSYMSCGILLLITLFQSIRRGELQMEPQALIVLIPFFLAIVLAFYIPTKLKTPYKRIETESYVDGKLVKKIDYAFEDTRVNESDILDSKF